jgi:hypothetical protein
MKNNAFEKLLFLLCLSFTINAQEGDFSILPTAGIAAPILDNGTGFTVGLNPAYTVNPYFSIEGQISYTYIKTTAFISGKSGKINSLYTLIGGRLYFLPKEKTVRPYINVLGGGNYGNDSDYNLGLSVGAFLEMKKTVMGLSFETSQNLVLKLGRIF